MENLHLRDGMQKLTSEHSRVQLHVKALSEQSEDMKRQLEEAAIVEASLRGEIDRIRAVEHEVRSDYVRHRHALATQQTDSADEALKSGVEIQRLRAELERAHRDLQEKNEALEAVQVPVSSQIPIRQVCRMSAFSTFL